ncbi:MAG: monovalent cation/H(+) antiporter subunit G [Pseudomonadota bacterium]|nr:monovalent cation/H(+) antiporter subunit G [Pseudomonadota bacterium]
MDTAFYILTWAAFLGGGFFLIVGGIGLLRFPDFYTRMHATGMTDTLGVGLMLLGMMMQAGLTLTAVKLAFIGFFIFFTSPTSTYAIANAAFSQGLKPQLANDDEVEGDPSKT